MTLIESALAPVLRGLVGRCAEEVGFSPAAGLVRLLQHQRKDTLALGLTELEPGSARSRTRDAHVLAAYGYLAARDGPGVHLPVDEWRRARAHLAGREAFPEDRASFFYRPWHLYGVALGVDTHREADADGVVWLSDLLESGLSHVTAGSLEQRIAFNLSARCCATSASVTIVETVEGISTAELALLLWARDRLGREVCVLRGEAPEAVLLDRALREGLQPRDAVDAAIALVALDGVLRAVRALLARDISGTTGQPLTIHGHNVQLIQGGTGSQTN